MKRVFELTKDIPGVKAGTLFKEVNDSGVYTPEGLLHPIFELKNFEDSDWFTEVYDWPTKWEDLPKESFRHCSWIQANGTMDERSAVRTPTAVTKNEVPTEKHAKSILAFAQLSMLATAMNGKWKPSFKEPCWTIYVGDAGELRIDSWSASFRTVIMFETREQAEFSRKHHSKLWLEYFMVV